MSISSFIQRVIPAATWLPNYPKSHFTSDLSAGLTTAVMLIPQGMAYAMLAGLPPIVGLYASMVPLALYALFGSSRELAVGPVAMVSLLVAASIAPLAQGGSADYWSLAVSLALMVGALQLLMGVARLGFIVNFLSHPVISGFTSAAALIIGLSQLKHFLGVNIPRSQSVFELLRQAWFSLGDIHPQTIAIGLSSLLLLIALKGWKASFPRALAVVVLGTMAVTLFDLDSQGVAIVGQVPAGLPSPTLPLMNLEIASQLWPTALTIALVGFMESISVAKAFATRANYDVDANQELIGLGLANLGGSLFQAYPVTGGFSRTAVNAGAGSKSPLASLITAAIVALALLFFTPLFYYLPKAVLASIIMAAVFGLIDIQEVKHLWTVKKSDFAMLVITFAATLALGIEEGILVGVAASLSWFILQSSRPHIAVLGRLPKRRDYRNILHYPEATSPEGVLIIRVDGPFYFANASFLKGKLAHFEEQMSQPLKHLLLDASAMAQLDASGAEALLNLSESCKRRNILLSFAGVKGPVFKIMQRAGVVESVGENAFTLNIDDALQTHDTA